LMGSLMLKYMSTLVEKRKCIYKIYHERLSEVPGISFSPEPESNVAYNYAYVPVQIAEKQFEMGRDALYEKLKDYNVFARRYFYPLLNEFACYQSVPIQKPLSVAEQVSKRILTLPIYADLQEDSVHQICDILIGISKS